MAYMNKYQSDDYRRDELIRIIEHSVEKLTLAELEALYYDMTTKSYINDWLLSQGYKHIAVHPSRLSLCQTRDRLYNG